MRGMREVIQSEGRVFLGWCCCLVVKKYDKRSTMPALAYPVLNLDPENRFDLETRFVIRGELKANVFVYPKDVCNYHHRHVQHLISSLHIYVKS